MSKMKGEKITYPVHKMGKRCGYDEFEDGSLRIAPSHIHTLQLAMDKQAAMDEFLASITRVSQSLSVEVSQLKKQFWDGVKEDYGLDANEEWLCCIDTRMLTRRKPKATP